MATIAVISSLGGVGVKDDSEKRRRARFALPLISLFYFLALPQTAPAAGIQQLDGELPGVLPVSLGEPTGCSASWGRMLNNGSYPASVIVTGEGLCPGNPDPLPYYWQNHQWIPLPLPVGGGYDGGLLHSVSDNLGGGQAFTLSLLNRTRSDWDSWVLGPGSVMSELTMLEGTNQIATPVISADGNHIVGGNTPGRHAVRWTKNGSGWSAPQNLGTGQAVATTATGDMVVGNNLEYQAACNNGPWIWADDGGGGVRVDLDADAQMYDISHDGSMIVGCRQKPCEPWKNCTTYPAAVYWTHQDGGWTRHDLETLDGVNGEAVAVAKVGGQSIILGYGYTNQLGGIQRVVVWIPEPDGSYGQPLRLEALGANFESWSWPNDINRQGVVLGWSETEPFGTAPPVIWSLFDQIPFQMNAGISDAWYNPATTGQGFLIIVWEDIQVVFLAWFTYDVERPGAGTPATLGEAGHRWLTAQGNYANNRAELTVYLSDGGVFDAGNPAPVTTPDGTMVVEFDNCLSGTVSYDIPSAGVMGVVPITRITDGHVAHCESSSAEAQLAQLSARQAKR